MWGREVGSTQRTHYFTQCDVSMVALRCDPILTERHDCPVGNDWQTAPELKPQSSQGRGIDGTQLYFPTRPPAPSGRDAVRLQAAASNGSRYGTDLAAETPQYFHL